MQRIIIFDYLVEGVHDLITELIENENNGLIVNWFNFKTGSIYYDNNGNEYVIKEISHDSKYVVLE